MQTVMFGKSEAQEILKRYAGGQSAPPDDQILQLAEAVVAKKRVVDLRQTLIYSLDRNERPKLAVARVGWKTVWCQWAEGNSIKLTENGHTSGKPVDFANYPRDSRRRDREAIRLPLPVEWSDRIMSASVPYIPPEYREAATLDRFLLWEAEWHGLQPRDPMLLEHLFGHFYAVVAEWNLTSLERAVLDSLEAEKLP